MDIELKKCRRPRALVKRRVNTCLKLLNETLVQDACLDWVEENKSKVKSLMNEVQNLDYDTVDIFNRYEIEANDE